MNDVGAGRANVNRRISLTVACVGTPSSCAPIVIRASALSTCASIAIGGTVCRSGSEVGDCMVASGQSIGMPVQLSALSSTSSSLQAVFT